MCIYIEYYKVHIFRLYNNMVPSGEMAGTCRTP